MENKAKVKYYSENKLISFLQVYGIFLVVFGHSFTSDSSIFLNRIIYSFHMPLFVSISGYLFINSFLKKSLLPSENNFFGKNGFLVKKTLRLLVPYFVISSLVFIPKSFFNGFALRPVDISVHSYIEMLIYPGRNVIIFFWFLPTIFIISVFSFFLWKLLLSKLELIGWLCSLVFFLFLTIINPFLNVKLLNISGVVHYLFYFLFGIFVFKYEDSMNSLLQKNLVAKLLIVLIIHLSIIFFTIGSPYYDKIIIFIAVLGILESYIVGKLYLDNNLLFVNHLNGSTYIIFLFSWFPQVFIQFIILRYFSLPWYLVSFISTLSGIYFPLGIFYLLNYLKKRNEIGSIISKIFGN
jgi:fucose 4-O-acetylase-like acetyltransferase